MGARAWRRASSVAMCSVNWSTSAWRASLSDTSLVEGKLRVSVRDACLLSRHEALVERGGCLARAFDPHRGAQHGWSSRAGAPRCESGASGRPSSHVPLLQRATAGIGVADRVLLRLLAAARKRHASLLELRGARARVSHPHATTLQSSGEWHQPGDIARAYQGGQQHVPVACCGLLHAHQPATSARRRCRARRAREVKT